MKQEGLPCDLLDRVRNDPYFSPILDNLDACVDAKTFSGLSERQVRDDVRGLCVCILFLFLRSLL